MIWAVLTAIGNAVGCWFGRHEWTDWWKLEDGREMRGCRMAACQKTEVRWPKQ